MRRLIAVITVLGLAFGAVSTLDLLRESGPASTGDITLDILEKLLLFGSMAAVAWAVFTVSDLREGQLALKSHLERNMAQGEAWRSSRQSEIAAMGQAITDQLRQWGLSPAETDVAGLLLKGCSMKEIAIARDTSEATIRQQAQTVYQKSGLSGRAELSAYFLDSLFSEAEDQGRARLRVVEP
jgi:DNA-binding CsgD family transcriptional regulator